MTMSKNTGLLAFSITATFYFSFFSGYLSSTIPGYFFAVISILLTKGPIKFTLQQYIVLIVTFSYFAFLITFSDSSIIVLKNIRYWFGIIIFIIFFTRISSFDFFTTRLFRALCYLVILEYFILFFFGVGQQDFKAPTVIVNQFRPLGLVSNASMSSALMCILFLLTEIQSNKKMEKFDFLLLALTILLLQSGVGVLIFFLVLFIRMKFNRYLFKVNLKNAGLILAVLIAVIIMLQMDQRVHQKFSLEYYYLVLGSKLTQFLNEVGSINFFSLIGTIINDDVPSTSGDFGWLIFLQTMGSVGLVLYFLILTVFYNSHYEYKPILILLLISTFHYPVLMTQTGQLIGAYAFVFLSNSPKNKNLISKQVLTKS